MSTRRARYRAYAWEPLTMTWTEVADAVFRRNEAWLRANMPADFPRPDQLCGLFHVEAVEAWARRHWGIASPEDTPEDVASRVRERMRAKGLRASEAIAAASADGGQVATARARGTARRLQAQKEP